MCVWSSLNRKSPDPSALRTVLRLSVPFVPTSLPLVRMASVLLMPSLMPSLANPFPPFSLHLSSNRQSIQSTYDYLFKHYDHIQYDRYLHLGIPIGSGFVESACKWLIQQRFKGVGMRWSEDGFNRLLHLRLTWVNGSFDDLFQPSPNSF